MEKQIDEMFQNAKPITEADDDAEVLADLAGYQVTKAELFSHTREPAVTIWETRVKFNMACLRRFPGVTHIQILIHPEQKRLIIRPCEPEAPDSLRWAKGGGEKELSNRDMLCRMFAAKVFDLMGWDKQYRYKMMGKPAIYNGEVLFLFKLTDFELFVNGGKKKGSYLPGEWRDYFGIPVEEHGKLVPDLITPVSEHRSNKYFKEEKLEQIAAQFGWTLITDENRKTVFMDMIEQMDMSYSYKPVLIKAIPCVSSDFCGAFFARFFALYVDDGPFQALLGKDFL